VPRLAYLLRFFRVVPPVPRLMTVTFAALALVAAGSTVIDPLHKTMIAPVVLLQAFAAASSFAGPARRGYYDLLFSRGEPRAAVAAVHWLMSVTPGVVAWLVVALIERIGPAGARGIGFSSGTMVAMILVSTIPWAVTVPLPRFAGAVGWLLVMAIGSVQLPLLNGDGAVAVSGVNHAPAVAPAALVIYPLLLVGHDLSVAVVPVSLALALAVVLMAAALVWIQRSDVPLEAAQ
jgi:hypothetical protein